MIEVHPDPPHAKSDGPQQLTIPQFGELLEELRVVAAAVGKTIV
jgi:3-deoxy-7-phosphoheptulonate synthase